ncbi:MAG: hypothetical protein E6K80_03435 [Candidatus Eisenbacteria bacterium]|uniref:Fibronectin type-III domain-containing protein n=1 Tax=Eiseniibacteriota bacterium TaxID=2212470 RepID=A0A538U8E3_UNCEI|nr:MAG: hypothetical protein E6K80_03435 [Candidatus Eisenbacteria bacterium]
MDARLSRHRTPSRMRREILPALLLLLGFGAALAPRSASAQTASADTVTLVWTAPGDDGLAGTADHYEVRMSPAAITASNWGAATSIGGAPAPLPSGARQSLVVRGLTRGTTYYFAIEAVDESNNVSALSNVVRWDWLYDTAPPAAPTGVSAALENGTDALVRWSSNSEPDLAGYTVYRRISAGGTYQPVSQAGFSGTQFIDTTIPAGTTQVWYQLTASDVSGNESARSASVSLALGGTVTLTTFDLQPAYPNPSRSPAAVNIPLSLPTAATASLFVMDSGGRRIRTLNLAGSSGGPQVAIWDGRNDAGNSVAPGVYTAWLVGAGHRRSIKLVRQP